MKVLVTTHAQMFQTPDGKIWSNSVYGYDFFRRYLDVFEEVRIVSRMKPIGYGEVDNKLPVNGPRVEVYPIPFYQGPWQFAWNSLKIRKKLLESIKECNCAVLRIPDQLAFQLFNILNNKKIPCAVEVVAHSWDLYRRGTLKTILRPIIRTYWDKKQKSICTKADCVSYVTEKYIQIRYPSKINEEDTDRFETSYTSADINSEFFIKPKSRKYVNKQTITLVHVAGINNTAKGHEELIKCISELNKNDNKEYKVTFIGSGTLFDYFVDMSKKLKVFNYTNFMGHISDPHKISEIFQKADIFVLPSLTEGLPRVILEAMASALPCIATNVGGIPELLSSECLVEPKDIDGLTKKIKEFSSNIELLDRESEKNYRYVLSNYAPRIIRKKRYEFYQFLKQKTRSF